MTAQEPWTPGPWAYSEGSDSVYAPECADGGDIICSSPGASLSDERWPANRTLIAAAPQLYKALADLVDAVRFDVDKRRRLERAEAILSKALGEA